MKYIRFTQIDDKTKISINVAHSKNGASWPEIKGLNILFQDIIQTEFWYGTVDDDAIDNPENQCWILSDNEFSSYVKQNVDRLIVMYKEKLYEEEKIVRLNVLGKYDSTASLAGIYKYDQALALLNDNTAPSPVIRLEAEARGLDPIDMAEKIKINHEKFRNTEAKIAGIRGKLLDRLNTYQFDDTDPIASWEDFHKSEVVGQITNQDPEQNDLEPEDVTTPYYGTDIGIRLAYME